MRLVALVCPCLAVTVLITPRADAEQSVSIEWAYLATYPEAKCTKIHVYVKNMGKTPVFLDGVSLGEQFFDLDLDRQEALDMVEADVVGGLGHASRADGSSSHKDGSVQWCRALPNPVEPDSITDVAVSLYGSVKEAALRIKLRGGEELRYDAKEEALPLRLSHIAFDPAVI